MRCLFGTNAHFSVWMVGAPGPQRTLLVIPATDRGQVRIDEARQQGVGAERHVATGEGWNGLGRKRRRDAGPQRTGLGLSRLSTSRRGRTSRSVGAARPTVTSSIGGTLRPTPAGVPSGSRRSSSSSFGASKASPRTPSSNSPTSSSTT